MLQNKKLLEDLRHKTRSDVDDCMRDLEQDLVRKDKKILQLLEAQQDQKQKLEQEEISFHDKLQDEVNSIKESYNLKHIQLKDSRFQIERKHRNKLQEQESFIAILQPTNDQLQAQLASTQADIQQYIARTKSLKVSRKSLFEDIDNHSNDCISIFEANMISLHKQYNTVIHSYLQQCIVEDPSLAIDLNRVITDITNSSKVEKYPKFTTKVSKEVNIDVTKIREVMSTIQSQLASPHNANARRYFFIPETSVFRSILITDTRR